MDRRAVLRAGLATGAAALAGCVTAAGGPGESGGEIASGGPGGGNATGETGTDGAGPALGEPTFEVVDSGCGVQRSAVAVQRDEDAGAILVEGTISARNACFTASLAEAVYGSGTDSLWVDVVAEERPDAGVCAQCITEISYRVRLPFSGGLPGRIAVTHDGTLVCPDGNAGRVSGNRTTRRTASR